MKLFDIIAYSSMASVVVPIVIGVTPNRRHHYYVKILLTGLFISALTDTIYFSKIQRGAILFHIYTVFEFIVLALLYKHLFHSVRIGKRINVVILLFIAFKVLDIAFITSLDEADNLAMTIEAIIMITFGLFYFDQVLREMVIPNLEQYPLFWINAGILIYFSGSLFLFLFSHYIFSNLLFYETFWSIHTVLTLIKNILFSVGLWLQK